MATRVRSAPLPAMNPFAVHEWYAGFRDQVPDVIEFVTSDRYLNRPNLYPRQATLLKIVFLQEELFTDYDYEVIGEWTQSYLDTADEKGEGNNGIVPDVLDRIRTCRAEGRKWFRENVMAIGRRGSKGYVGALAGAYVLWRYLSLGDPQGHFGVDRDKRLACQVFAAKKEDARAHQWRDLKNVITGAPCFAPYIADDLTENLLVYAPYDFARIQERFHRGVPPSNPKDLASFIVEPRESTTTAGRGPASFCQFYDEMAHVVRQVARADAAEVYEGATPALDQFGEWAFMWEPSSTWQRVGQFYENYSKALEHEEDGSPSYPEVLMVQLTSWDIYRDWERAHDLVARPEHVKVFEVPDQPTKRTLQPEIRFQGLKRAIQTYDEQMQRLERANPDTFKVERRSHFAAVLDAYLNPERIREMWQPWPQDRSLVMQDKGILARLYRAHGDPSKSGANFGFAIAHVEYHPLRDIEMARAKKDKRPCPAEYELPHVVFDWIHHWIPGDFEEGEVDYEHIGTEIIGRMDAFMPNFLSFDQWNSVATIQRLRKHAHQARYPKRVEVYERTATGPLNWKTYETFKTALGLGLVHAPYYEQASLELQFLQDAGHQKVEAPTAGPVQVKDVADCLAICTYELVGNAVTAWKEMGEFSLSATHQGGTEPFRQMNDEVANAFSNWGRRSARRPEMRGTYRKHVGPR